MADILNLNKQVYSKTQFEKVINRLMGDPHPRKGYIKVKFTSKIIEEPNSDNENISLLDK